MGIFRRRVAEPPRDPREYVEMFTERKWTKRIDNWAVHAAKNTGANGGQITPLAVLRAACTQTQVSAAKLTIHDRGDDPEGYDFRNQLQQWAVSPDLDQAVTIGASAINGAGDPAATRAIATVVLAIVTSRAYDEAVWSADQLPVRGIHAVALGDGCEACNALDGREYSDFMEVHRDYRVSGGMRRCAAAQCRCLSVVVDREETPPAGQASPPLMTTVERIRANLNSDPEETP